MTALDAKKITMKAMIDDPRIEHYMNEVYSDIEISAKQGSSHTDVRLPEYFYRRIFAWILPTPFGTAVIQGLSANGFTVKPVNIQGSGFLSISW